MPDARFELLADDATVAAEKCEAVEEKELDADALAADFSGV